MSRYMNLIGKNARKASLEKINTKIKNKVLKRYVLLLEREKNSIFKANIKDIKFAIRKKLKSNLIDRLTQKKIPSVIYYKFPIHLMEAFKYLGFQKGSLPISENLSHSIVSLPMHPYLTKADIDFIVNTIQTK